MNTLEVFDKPMCCSTGVCGPRVDPVLPQFAADLDWLEKNGVQVERFNLAHQPAEFVKAADVSEAVAQAGTDCLPIVRLNGNIVSRGIYLSRDQLAQLCRVSNSTNLPIADVSCCDGPGCC